MSDTQSTANPVLGAQSGETTLPTHQTFTNHEVVKTLSNRPPIIQTNNRKQLKDKDQPVKFGVNVNLEAVAYLRFEGKDCCAVKIEVHFDTKKSLKLAEIPFNCILFNSDMQGDDDPLVDLQLFYPKEEEKVPLVPEQVHRETLKQPELNFSAGGVQLGGKGVGTKTESNYPVQHCMSRSGYQWSRSEFTKSSLTWKFENDSPKQGRYPSRHVLLLIVSYTCTLTRRTFPFTIQLTNGLSINSGGFRTWPSRKPEGGWIFDIKECNWNPHMIDDLLKEVVNNKCQSISLRQLVLGASTLSNPPSIVH